MRAEGKGERMVGQVRGAGKDHGEGVALFGETGRDREEEEEVLGRGQEGD